MRHSIPALITHRSIPKRTSEKEPDLVNPSVLEDASMHLQAYADDHAVYVFS